MLSVIRLSSLIFITVLSQLSLSQEVIDMSYSVKDLGRGGVYIPSVTDANAMYHNPAMLAYTSGVRWSVMNIQAGINDPNNLTLIQNSPPAQNTLSQYYGKNIWTGETASTTIAMPYFGVGLVGDSYLDFIATNPSLPQVSVTELVDYGVVMGTGFNISNDFAFGLNLKRLTRVGGTGIIGAAQIATLNMAAIQNAVTNNGSGYGVDAGIYWKPQNVVNTAVSVAWSDIGDTAFIPAAGAIAPPPQLNNLVLGVTTQQHAAGFGWAAGVEYRHIRNDPIDITKKTHVGVELDLGILDLRSGFYQGWLTYGATVDLWFLSLDLAKYTVERGAYAGQNGEDRYQVGLSFDAGFDANFNFMGMGGKNHKLKARR